MTHPNSTIAAPLDQKTTACVAALQKHDTVDLGRQITPIEHLQRLGGQLGLQLFAKRDDALLLAMGGNKVRQLEYYLGPAKAQGADTVLITGAIQSNFVRLCAAAAARLGWRAIVQLEDRVPKDDVAYNTSGNVLLNKLLGAEIVYFPEGENEAAADANLDRMADELRATGKNPFVVHLGMGHPPVGGLGYAMCAVECAMQLRAKDQQIDHVVIPSGSGLTHAGFLVGARAIGWDVPVHGICVRRDALQQMQRIETRAHEINDLIGLAVPLSGSDVVVHDRTLAPGYGQMNDAVHEAIRLGAQQEGLLLDPVYTGRTMAGLIELVRFGVIKPGQSVLFIHTGGIPAMFAYQTDLMSVFSTGVSKSPA